MDFIFHLLGLCPDHVAHFDIIDILIAFDYSKQIIYQYLQILWQRLF